MGAALGVWRRRPSSREAVLVRVDLIEPVAEEPRRSSRLSLPSLFASDCSNIPPPAGRPRRTPGPAPPVLRDLRGPRAFAAACTLRPLGKGMSSAARTSWYRLKPSSPRATRATLMAAATRAGLSSRQKTPFRTLEPPGKFVHRAARRCVSSIWATARCFSESVARNASAASATAAAFGEASNAGAGDAAGAACTAARSAAEPRFAARRPSGSACRCHGEAQKGQVCSSNELLFADTFRYTRLG